MKKVDPKQSLPKLEEEILKYWEENKVFEQSVEKDAPMGDYVFYDGPPFATGTPHYGHIVGQTLKDAVPRYWTMRGYRVERTWGWDCHGLPIENIAEKALGAKHKKDIEAMGVGKFNDFCRSTVLEYAEEWNRITTRLGRWADREHAYRTMDLDYMESVWWVFKQLWDKGLIYESYRIMHVCTRCETTLSQSEVSEGYVDVKDLSATTKFPIVARYPSGEQNKNCRLIITDEQGRILMGKEKTHEDMYNFPGGHLRVGESYQDAARREAREELNVDIEVLGAKFAGFWVDGKVRPVIMARIVSGRVTETEEVGDFVWYTPQEIEVKLQGCHRMVQFAWKSYVEGRDISFEELQAIEPITVSMLAWTTTPWTLPGNVALAVGRDVEYARVKVDQEYFVCAKNLVEKVFAGKEFSIDAIFLGDDYIGRRYLPPFDSYAQDKTLKNYENGWRIYAGDFVTTDMGTGVVHIASAFGEDDWNLARQENLPFVQHVRMDGTVKEEVKELAGMTVKPKENPQATDIEVIKYLAGKGLLFAKEKYEHSYPHCWRCDTPLINYATSSWFVKVTDVKERAIEHATQINWSPEHVKAGRFGKWLEGARDWSISRQRFWASVMPIWKCEGSHPRLPDGQASVTEYRASSPQAGERGCNAMRVFGSVKELEEASGVTITDLHKHVVDPITVPCAACGGTMRRIPDVLDTWFDSGSMPYAQKHYPFEGKESFEGNFPAQFIAEGVDQTRAWFYYLHILGTALMDRPAFQNVIVNGIVQAEDGKKMSKKLKNYPDPSLMMDKYGADALRLYLLSSPVVAAENINFSEKDMGELSRSVFRMLWNSYSFFAMYAEIDDWKPDAESRITNHESSEGNSNSKNILDQWILSELQLLIREVNTSMEAYDIQRATRAIAPFVDNLSNWYIRRSRKRFWKNDDVADKQAAFQTLYDVLVTLAKVMAPLTPFIAEEIYRNLVSLEVAESDPVQHNLTPTLSSAEAREKFPESVHLAEYPTVDENLIDASLMVEMKTVRNLVTVGLAIRSEHKKKVRQPLNDAVVFIDFIDQRYQLPQSLQDIIQDELNVKRLIWFESREEFVQFLLKNDRYLSLKDDNRELVSERRSNPLALNGAITPELKLEGDAREIVRFIQELRKEAGYNVDDRIVVGYEGMAAVFADEGLRKMIVHEVLAIELIAGTLTDADRERTLTLGDDALTASVRRSETM